MGKVALFCHVGEDITVILADPTFWAVMTFSYWANMNVAIYTLSNIHMHVIICHRVMKYSRTSVSSLQLLCEIRKMLVILVCDIPEITKMNMLTCKFYK